MYVKPERSPMIKFRTAKSPQVFTAPEPLPEGSNLFLAGGITDCPDWQAELINLLLEGNTKYNLLNPRRGNFDVRDPNASEVQIKWENEALMSASAISFWFPCDTLCPITLYELGKHSQRGVPIFIGVHPDYKRRIDVEIQTGLCRPEIKIVYSIEDLAGQLLEKLP